MEYINDVFPPGRDRTEASLRLKLYPLIERLSPGALKKLEATLRDFLHRGETLFLEECSLSSTEDGDAIIRWSKDDMECHVSHNKIVLKKDQQTLLWDSDNDETFLSIMHEVPNCRYRWVRRYSLSDRVMDNLTSTTATEHVLLSDNYILYELTSVAHLGIKFIIPTASIIIIKQRFMPQQPTYRTEQFVYKGHRFMVNDVDRYSCFHLEKYGGSSNRKKMSKL